MTKKRQGYRAVLLLGLMAAASAAQACGGSLIAHKPVNVGGQQIAQLQVYYNPGNGNNCAMMVHGGPTWGVPLNTRVSIARCVNGCAAYTSPVAIDDNTYSFHAGPVAIPGRGHCVWAQGSITWQGAVHTVNSKGHCQ